MLLGIYISDWFCRAIKGGHHLFIVGVVVIGVDCCLLVPVTIELGWITLM